MGMVTYRVGKTGVPDSKGDGPWEVGGVETRDQEWLREGTTLSTKETRR